MSEPLAPQHGPQPDEIAQEPPATPAARLARWQDAGVEWVAVNALHQDFAWPDGFIDACRRSAEAFT